MLIDLHAHSSGVSKCCRIPAPEVLHQALDLGLDGIVLTNHYQKSYISDGDAHAFAEKYLAEYAYARVCGDQIGCKVFFGVELTTELYPNVHMLLYGVDGDFLLRYPTLYELTQTELYRLVRDNGGTVVQAHPFRNGAHVLDVQALDGVEINCHPLYGKSYAAELIDIASVSGLMLTCGGDYHADTYRPHCGTYLPDDLTDAQDIGDYLRSTDRITLCVHEPNTASSADLNFTRS